MRSSGFDLMVSGVLGGLVLFGAGCQSKSDPSFIDRERTVEYRLDDAQALSIYDAMVEDCRVGRWRDNWERTSLGRDPKILVGRIRNETDDFVDTRLLSKRLEQNFLETRNMRVVSDPSQQDLPTSVPGLTQRELLQRGVALDADFVLAGSVSDYEARNDSGDEVWMYEISLDLVAVPSTTVADVADIAASEKVWTNTEAIEKSTR
ncbi:MAG: hypothetical protein AAF108_08360 [Planctomycetota bacterium]